MNRFVADLERHWPERPFVWRGSTGDVDAVVPPPRDARVLVLAPHPDDPESAAIALRILVRRGCDVHYAIACLSAAGVQDQYIAAGERGPALRERKEEIRRGEQLSSAAAMGVGRGRIEFLNLREEQPLDTPSNRAAVIDHLGALSPHVVILPVGRDTNATHTWVHRVFRRWAMAPETGSERPVVALYNEDPKTVRIRPDLLVPFGREGARWKGELLRMHDSQQQRNLRQRQQGFDQRILDVNRRGAASGTESYVERFEIEVFGHLGSRRNDLAD